MWDLETGKCIKTLEGHTSYVLSVAISPDARAVLSGSDDKTVRCDVQCCVLQSLWLRLGEV